MAYERKNDGTNSQTMILICWQVVEKIDHYMKNYNESMRWMLLPEAELSSRKITGNPNDKWFKKIDKKYREKLSYNKLEGAPHQWDLVRDF